MRWTYAKQLTNLRTSLGAVCGPGADVATFASAVNAEALACYRAADIEFAPSEEDENRRIECGFQMLPIPNRPGVHGSAWQSLERRLGSIETDYLNGDIVLMEALHGIPTPYNRALQEAANELAGAMRPPGNMPIQELTRRAEAWAR